MGLFAAGSTHPLPHRRVLEFSKATAVKGFVQNKAKLKCSEGGEVINSKSKNSQRLWVTFGKWMIMFSVGESATSNTK